MLQNRDKSERENFYHNLAQFMLPILAKKKVALQALFFRGNEKKWEDRRLACPRDFIQYSKFAI